MLEWCKVLQYSAFGFKFSPAFTEESREEVDNFGRHPWRTESVRRVTKPTPMTCRCVAYICTLFYWELQFLFSPSTYRSCQRNNLTVRRPGLLLLAVTRHYMLQDTRLLILRLPSHVMCWKKVWKFRTFRHYWSYCCVNSLYNTLIVDKTVMPPLC
jgi:hypothetical protein